MSAPRSATESRLALRRRSSRAPFLYEDLAQTLVGAIDRGALRPGDRLPSVRALSAQEGVSVSTVLQAYLHLEALGLLETRPQSGHYVRVSEHTLPEEPQVAMASHTATAVTVSDLVHAVHVAARDPRIVPFGAAVPAPELLPTARLHRLLSRAARTLGSGAAQYDLPPGLPALRQQLARRSVGWGCPLPPDAFITTCGASEAVVLCLLAVAKPGETILVESPAYFGMLQAIESLSLRALEVPCHPREGLQLAAVEAALARTRVTAVLASTNFSNPLGSLMPDVAKSQLVALLADKGIPLIEDDLYGDLHFGPTRPVPARAFDKTGNVLLCGSFSKTLAPGFRVGWVAPGRFLERVERLKSAHSVATPTLPQIALAEFLRTSSYDRHLRRMRREVSAQVQQTLGLVSQHFPPGTRVTRPQGGMMLWVELPETVRARELHAAALAERISIAPGPIFSARGEFEHCIRLSCGHPLHARAEAALSKLGRLATRLAQS